MDIEFGDDVPLAVSAAVFADTRDAVEHQHRGRRKPRVVGPEKRPLGALEELLLVE